MAKAFLLYLGRYTKATNEKNHHVVGLHACTSVESPHMAHYSGPHVDLQAPLYPDKAEMFHRSTFVLGYDTAIRLVMPKYYGGHDGMLLQLASMSHLGCSVLVAGRAVSDDQGNSNFKTFEDVEVPEAITKLVGLEHSWYGKIHLQTYLGAQSYLAHCLQHHIWFVPCCFIVQICCYD